MPFRPNGSPFFVISPLLSGKSKPLRLNQLPFVSQLGQLGVDNVDRVHDCLDECMMHLFFLFVFFFIPLKGKTL